MTDSSHGYLALAADSTDTVDALASIRYARPGETTVRIEISDGGYIAIHPDGRSYSYSYGPGGLKGLFYNRYALGCAVFASIGGLCFGYDQGVMANIFLMEDFLSRWELTPLEKGSMTAVLELGALFGVLVSGLLADMTSRRHSISFAYAVFACGSALQCSAHALSHLYIGRAIGGFGVGALSMLSPLYIAEISAPEVRGSLMALEQFSIVLGVVFGFWIGFFTRNVSGSLSWRIPLALQLIPGVLLALLCGFLPSSPRLLVLRGSPALARSSLSRLRDRRPDDTLIQLELLEMEAEVELMKRIISDERDDTSTWGRWRIELRAWARLFDRKYVSRTLVGVLMMFFQQWSGINALLYYGPTLVNSVGLKGELVTLVVSGGIGIVQLLAVFPAIILIDRWGRKPLLRGGSAVMASSHLLIALLIRVYGLDWPGYPAAAWTAVICLYTFTAAYGVSYGPIGWILPSEVFPLSMRSRGVAVSTASNWINNFLIGLITPVLMDLSAATTFLIFSCACFAGYMWSTYIVPETANVSLEEIDAVFSSSAGQEDARLKFEIGRELGLHDLIRSVVE